MIQIIMCGGGGNQTDRLFPDDAPLTKDFWAYQFSKAKPWINGLWFQSVAGCIPAHQQVSAGMSFDNTWDIKSSVGTAPQVPPNDRGWLVAGFAPACRAWMAANPGKPVYAYCGPVAQADGTRSAMDLYNAHCLPYTGAGATVAIDTLMACTKASATFKLADYAHTLAKSLIGESSEQLAQSWLFPWLSGVSCQSRPPGHPDDRMGLCYAHPDLWMTADSIHRAGIKPIACCYENDKPMRLALAQRDRARGFEVAIYAHDLEESECVGL